MVTGAEIGFGLKALGGVLGLTQQLLKLSNDANTRAIVIEMQGKILEAQGSAIEAQSAHAAQVEQISALKAEIAKFETWDREKDRYELKTVGNGVVAYMLKPPSRGSEPPHWLCPTCYENGEKQFLQHNGTGFEYRCGKCKTLVAIRGTPSWIT